jgi:hypothetical protein
VVNVSIGWASPCNAVDTIVKKLIAKGIHVVASAGNNNEDASNHSPACVDEAITVGNADIKDERNETSNYGSVVDFFAPGTEITSASINDPGYEKKTGTSMSAPHAAGMAAYLISVNGNKAPSDIKADLVNLTLKNLLSINTNDDTANRLLRNDIEYEDVPGACGGIEDWLKHHHRVSHGGANGDEDIHIFAVEEGGVYGHPENELFKKCTSASFGIGPLVFKVEICFDFSNMTLSVCAYCKIPWVPEIKLGCATGNLKDGVTITFKYKVVRGTFNFYIKEKYVYLKYHVTIFGKLYEGDIKLIPVPFRQGLMFGPGIGIGIPPIA